MNAIQDMMNRHIFNNKCLTQTSFTNNKVLVRTVFFTSAFQVVQGQLGNICTIPDFLCK